MYNIFKNIYGGNSDYIEYLRKNNGIRDKYLTQKLIMGLYKLKIY